MGMYKKNFQFLHLCLIDYIAIIQKFKLNQIICI